MSKIVALKMKAVPGAIVGRWFVGEIVQQDNDSVVLKNTCAVYDFLKMTPQGEIFPQSVVAPDDIILEDNLSVRIDETEASRNVLEGSSLYAVYTKALADYRANKAGITLDPKKAPKPKKEGVVASLKPQEEVQ